MPACVCVCVYTCKTAYDSTILYMRSCRTAVFDDLHACVLVQGRTPFHVPDQVTWPQLAQALNTKFTAACGKSLSTENCSYLASKLFGEFLDSGRFLQLTYCTCSLR